MTELKINLACRFNQTPGVIQKLLDLFESRTKIHVILDVDSITRSNINDFGLYHRGPDVSGMASTWVHDLITMNALRQFEAAEMNARLGQKSDFLSGAWGTCQEANRPEIWAVPWMNESIIIHYRTDLLEKAGVNPATAFQSLASIARAAAALQKIGVPVPVEMPFHWLKFDQLHAFSGWLWSNGGEYISDDCSRVLLDQPKEVSVLSSYFGLLRYATQEGAWQIMKSKEALFPHGKSAISFSSHMEPSRRQCTDPELLKNWSSAAYPRVSFLGGNNLVIWKHTRFPEEALELVKFLTSAEAELALFHASQMLPARLAVLDHPDIAQDPNMKAGAASIRQARSYRIIPFWGMVEDMLIRIMENIQVAMLRDQTVNVETVIRREVEPAVKRMNNILSQ